MDQGFWLAPYDGCEEPCDDCGERFVSPGGPLAHRPRTQDYWL